MDGVTMAAGEDSRVRRSAAFLFFVYLLLSLAWPLSVLMGVAYSAWVTALMALATCLFFGATWLYLRQRSLGRLDAESVLLVFGLIMTANSTAYILLVPDPIHSTNFALILLSGAFVLFSRPHLVVLALAALAGWLWAALAAGITSEWFHWGAMLLLAGMLASLAQEIRIRVTDRLLKLSQAAEEKQREAQDALRVAERELEVRKQTERALVSKERELAQAQRQESLGMLAGGMAHDFNNLLQVLVAHAELGLLDAKGHTKVEGHFNEIRNVSLQGAALIDSMLAYAGAAPARFEVLPLRDVVYEAVKLIDSLLPKSTRAILDNGFASDVTVRVDCSLISQVLLNLVLNASDALPGAVGAVHVSIGATDCGEDNLELEGGVRLPPGRYGYIEVADSGSGMSVDVRQRMFEPFFSTKFTGRGLGLAACLGIAKLHHGGFRVSSVKGEGTTIRLLLPLVAAR